MPSAGQLLILCHLRSINVGLSDVFFEQMGVRPPDHYLGARAETFGEQIGQIVTLSERVMREQRPDRLLILGDTNSALSSIVAKRLGIPVYHMEAGNRCYDDRVPEEVNRRIHCRQYRFHSLNRQEQNTVYILLQYHRNQL